MEVDLPGEIHKRVADCLDTRDVLSFTSSCKKIKKNLDLAVVDDIYSHSDELTDQRWLGSYNGGDKEVIWFRFMPLLLQSHQIHTVQFSCQFKDQGWGNRKGRLFIYEDKNHINHQGNVVACSPIADHGAKKLRLSFRPVPGKNYTMCYVVGGGGGHELYVTDPKIRILTYHDRGISDIARKFQQNTLVPILKNSFGESMMIAVIDSLIGSIERGEEPDVGLVSCLTSVGLDTGSVESLERIKFFFTLLHQFRN